jgi:hypothetical protein
MNLSGAGQGLHNVKWLIICGTILADATATALRKSDWAGPCADTSYGLGQLELLLRQL